MERGFNNYYSIIQGEERLFASALNCESVETAYQEMMNAKVEWRKEDGVLGYHIIQSFKPGEVTPEEAHQIGLEFAQKMFGERFQVVVGTHLDQKHLHNHIVIQLSVIHGWEEVPDE